MRSSHQPYHSGSAMPENRDLLTALRLDYQNSKFLFSLNSPSCGSCISFILLFYPLPSPLLTDRMFLSLSWWVHIGLNVNACDL